VITHFGKPTVDLFVSRLCHQIDQYMAWKPDSKSFATDAMQQPWEGFAFPPFSLISRIIKKVLIEKVEKLILITPSWQTQPWVRTTFEPLNSKTSNAPSKTQHSQKSSRIESSSSKTRITKTSDLEIFRNSLQIEGISNRDATLISQARREGSLTNYESSFQKWASWCHRDKIDPFQAPLNKILDFLADLFDKGYQYRKRLTPIDQLFQLNMQV